ncbi:hypothetical protein A1Q2_08037 [Trichosporon asahii var. asahii CBS 8904]|uniref:Uncharacterized protein n=1 Tax=Trichosporon asahii var. asahii (strain CBS 8904) TaxID=1220162 RepID=K1VF32_TRIAC|nr:hypothetical protein A1Q2_08037 [Trichosporon asahii var. asahii CBS 8904]
MEACLATGSEKRWIDPASAYKQLRQSPLFSHHLVSLFPRIRTLYANLRAAGCHEELLSDLLLRAPNHRVLREILNEEADSEHPQTEKERLRLSLVAQAYRVIAPSIKRKVLARLSRPALVGVSRALREEDANDLLTSVFYELSATAKWDRRDWPLLEIALHLARTDPQAAVKLLHYPLALGKLPGHIDGSIAEHPRAASLVVQITVARAALQWKKHVRATRAIDDLLDTLRSSKIDPAAVELILEAIRTADVAPGDDNLSAWAHEKLLLMANDSRFPPLPTSAINLHMEGLSLSDALDFYLALPNPVPGPGQESVRWYNPPSARQITRLALANPPPTALRRLAYDARSQPMPPEFLRTLADAGLLAVAEAIYYRSSAIDERTALALIRAFTRGHRSAQRTAFAKRVAREYLATGPGDETKRALFRVRSDALIGRPQEKEVPLNPIVLEPPSVADSGSLANIQLQTDILRSPTDATEFGAAAADSAAETTEPGSERTAAETGMQPGNGADSISALISLIGEETAFKHLVQMAEDEPFLARRLTVMARPWFVLPPSGAAFAAACANAKWKALNDVQLPSVLERDGTLFILDRRASLSSIQPTEGSDKTVGEGEAKYPPTEAEAPFVVSLVRARAGRLASAVKWFEHACLSPSSPASPSSPQSSLSVPSHPMLLPTASALLQKCAIRLRWDLGFRVLRQIATNDAALHIILRWFSDMGRLGGRVDKAPQAWEREKKNMRKRLWRLHGREIVRHEIEGMEAKWERRGVMPRPPPVALPKEKKEEVKEKEAFKA